MGLTVAISRTGWTVEKQPGGGLHPLPPRCVVERTLAGLGKFRRLSKDYEALPCSEETGIRLAMTGVTLIHLDGAAEGKAA